MYSEKKKKEEGKKLNNKWKTKLHNQKIDIKQKRKKYYCTLHKNMSHFIKLYTFC